jgi:hypothetical protein
VQFDQMLGAEAGLPNEHRSDAGSRNAPEIRPLNFALKLFDGKTVLWLEHFEDIAVRVLIFATK